MKKPQLTYTITYAGMQLSSFAEVYPRECAFKHYAERLLHYTARSGFFNLGNEWLAQKWGLSIGTVRNVIAKMEALGLVRIYRKVRTKDKRSPRGWFNARIIVFDKAAVKVRYADAKAQAAYDDFEGVAMMAEPQATQLQQQVAQAFREQADDQQQVAQLEKEVKEMAPEQVKERFSRSAVEVARLLLLTCALEVSDGWDALPLPVARTLIAGAQAYTQRLGLNDMIGLHMHRLRRKQQPVQTQVAAAPPQPQQTDDDELIRQARAALGYDE